MSEQFYNINGIPAEKATSDEFWVLEWSGQFSINKRDITPELDIELIRIGHLVAERLFGSVQKMYDGLMRRSTWLAYAGLDAEIKISKTNFEKLVQDEKGEDTHRYLYYYDYQNIIGSLQNLVQESKFLLCEFYKIFNLNHYMLAPQPIDPDGLNFASGLLVTTTFSRINHLFINLASQLDFITKIIYELEHMPTDFSSYPKLKCRGILFGDHKKFRDFDITGTVFEKNVGINLILNLRNEIVHNASIEGNSKVYQLFESGKMIEKFILIPDTTDGNFDASRNRNRFYDNDTKLNQVLPELVCTFWEKMMVTVKKILAITS